MQLILRMAEINKDPRYLAAARRSVDFVLKSQYDNGGWPQRWPQQNPYVHHGMPDYTGYITFNDDVARQNIEFLRLAYKLLGDGTKIRCTVERLDDGGAVAETRAFPLSELTITPLEVVYGACYLFLDKCFVYLSRPKSETVGVRLTARSSATPADLDALAGEFVNELVSQATRLRLSQGTARLRQAWPNVPIIVRGDSGFCRQRLMRWCERHGVGYVLGMARNARLEAIVSMTELALAEQYAASGMKQREIGEFSYAADSWDRERRVITRLEYGSQGNNPRFVVTNVQGEAAALYDRLYCQRGEAENRIKETQLDLFGTRASCHKFLANQFRLLLAALAYTLMQRLRTLALSGTELARACAATIRTRLLKIGVGVLRNTRRVRLMFASHHPLRELFALAAARLVASTP
jgi:His-Xaa-Ser system protein HxsD